MSIEEKYDEVRQLINIGKEKGYLLYDEVNELLPSEITSSDELDDLFNTFGSAGIEVIDSDQKYLRDDKPIDRTAKASEELELDLTPGALDKTNDPVRMYLREMGTVPAAHARGRSRDRAAHRARQARRHQVDLAHAARRQARSSRSATRCTPATARSASWSSSTTRRSPTSASPSGRGRCRSRSTRSARRPRRRRSSQEKLARDAEGRDDARQAEVPPGALGGDARARRAVAAHPRDRVHRIGEAPPDRRDEGRRRSVKSVQREIEAIDRLLNPKNKKQQLREETRRTSSGRSRNRSSS